MVLLDTNILIYAANKDSEHHPIAFQIREEALMGKSETCVSLQNLVEFYSIITSSKRVQNPLSPEIASYEINQYLNNDKIVKFHFNEQSLKLLTGLTQKYKVTAQNVYDLKIVATMLTHGVSEIITANETDFIRFSEVKVQNPFKR